METNKSKHTILKMILQFAICLSIVCSLRTIEVSAEGYTGLYDDPALGWIYVENDSWNYNYYGLIPNEYGWWCVSAGKIDFGYTGLWYDPYVGWWYVQNGMIDFNYNGLAQNDYGWWAISGGTVDFGYNGLKYDPYVGWWYVQGGMIDFGYNGLAQNENGWWAIKGGTVDFGYNGLKYDPYVGWWYVQGGMIDFGYNGLAQNEYGWWAITSGTVDFGYTGFLPDYYQDWCFVQSGLLNRSYKGWYYDANYGWGYVTNGEVSFSHTGVANDGKKCWYIKDGEVVSNYTGIAYDDSGRVYYFENGVAQSNSTGIVNLDTYACYVVNGLIDNTVSWVNDNGVRYPVYKGVVFNEYTVSKQKKEIERQELYGAKDLTMYSFSYYLSNSMDVQAGVPIYSVNAFYDFANNGMKLGKKASDKFDVAAYRAYNSDLNTLFGNNLEYYYIHFFMFGEDEGRDCLFKNVKLSNDSPYQKYEYVYKTGNTAILSSSDERTFYANFKKYLDYAYQFNTQVLREKAIHDYMVLNTAYDYDNLLNDSIPTASYRAEGVVINKTAVCDGYRKAFNMFMDVLGIECIGVVGTGNGGGHAWNQVKLGGEWYVVDVTWDDPVPDTPGQISYDYFNITTAEVNLNHVAQNNPPVANGTKYSAENILVEAGKLNVANSDIEEDAYYNKLLGEWYNRVNDAGYVEVRIKVTDSRHDMSYIDSKFIQSRAFTKYSNICVYSNSDRGYYTLLYTKRK